MKEILFLNPVFKEMIWGGSRLREEFQYEIPGEKTGECWAVSAHSNGDCEIAAGTYQGKTLSWLWKQEHSLFGNAPGEVFPLLVKIIDAREDLSIQVHPDDAYAKIHENGSLGKTECWYILDCDPGASIVIGHTARDTAQLRNMISDGKWEDLLSVRPIKKGDFFQIKPGTVHAIKAGTLILEIQQSSDITYRLYDYGRLKDGQPRELHLEKSMDVIGCPHIETAAQKEVEKRECCEIEELVSCEFYTVSKVSLHGEAEFQQKEPFTIIDIMEGEGAIDHTPLKKGMHLILPAGYGKYRLTGEMDLMISHI